MMIDFAIEAQRKENKARRMRYSRRADALRPIDDDDGGAQGSLPIALERSAQAGRRGSRSVSLSSAVSSVSQALTLYITP